MEDNMTEFLENSLYEEIFLYNELLNCFRKEREVLINMDLDNLWCISKEKNELCSKINSIEQKIFSAVRPELDQQHVVLFEKSAGFNKCAQLSSFVADIVKEKDKSKFQGLYYSLQKFKSEIDVMRKVNTQVIEHSLQFLDEMISIITGQAHQDVIYNDKRVYNHSKSSMLMSREV